MRAALASMVVIGISLFVVLTFTAARIAGLETITALAIVAVVTSALFFSRQRI